MSKHNTIGEFIEDHINRGKSPTQIAGDAVMAGVIDGNTQNMAQLRHMAMKRTGWDVVRVHAPGFPDDSLVLMTTGSITDLTPTGARLLAKALLCAAQEIDGNECLTACFKVQGRISHAHREELIERVEAAIEESNLFDGVEVL